MHNSDSFFYSQSTPTRKSKPIKKVINEITLKNLNLKINNKYPLSSDLCENDENDLIERIKQLTHINNYIKDDKIEEKNDTNLYTNMRLQTIKLIGDELIQKLENELSFFSENLIKPTLPGRVIYDWHADWSALTENCKLKNFPLWQTKEGSELIIKKSTKFSTAKIKEKNIATTSLTRLSADIENTKENHTRRLSKSAVKSHQAFRLSVISEKRRKSSSKSSKADELTANRLPKANELLTTEPARILKLIGPNRKESLQMSSISNTSSTGYFISYELSNKNYMDKGWTAVSISSEEQQVINKRKTFKLLRNSLQNM
jgi:hypothetical protein